MAYQEMALLYDQLMVGTPYDKWLTFTKEIIEKSGKNVSVIADLGCGTGEVTIRLAEAGYMLYGVDYSTDMLSHAQQKGSKKNLPIQWLMQDLRELRGLENLDAVVSYCDVMNYIVSEADLRIVFSNIFNSLKADGLFIFDVHAMNYVEEQMIDHSFTEVTDEIIYIWDCIGSDVAGEMHHDLTFFSMDEHGKYDRFDEYHHQRTYSIEFYRHILLETGFENIEVYGDFCSENQKTSKKAERIFFVANKGSR